MMEKCAKVVVDWLTNCKVVKTEDKELYSYAIYSLLLLVSPLLLAVFFGLCMGCVARSITIVVPFMIVRKFSGGYHARSAWTCLLCSGLLLLLCNVLSFYVKCGWTLAFLTVGVAVSLICNSPIDNENRVLSREEHNSYKRITAVLVIILLLVDMLFFVFHLPTYSVCISIGMMLSAGLQLPCILKKMIKKMFKK